MQGNLESPPIIIGAPRLKLAIGFVISMVAAGLIKFWLNTPFQIKFFSYCFIVIFGAGLLLSPHLTLSPEGLLYRNKLGKRFWAWRDFDQFCISESPLFGFNAVGFVYSPDYIHREQPFSNALSQLKKGALWPFWEISTPALVLLLNKARERWSLHAIASNS